MTLLDDAFKKDDLERFLTAKNFWFRLWYRYYAFKRELKHWLYIMTWPIWGAYRD